MRASASDSAHALVFILQERLRPMAQTTAKALSNGVEGMEHEFLAGLEIVRTEIHGEDQKPPRQDIWVVKKPY
jgi:hypothetical protein